jgi:two-component system, OmpR family, manganese sensing response regulator
MQPKKLKILFAEDHEDTRELYVFVLERANYEVSTAKEISGAMALAAKRKFDLFVLDSRLLDGSGIELCKRIREIDPVTPILFCSALAFEKDKLEALNAGAQRYLVKPVSILLLCQTIAEMIVPPRSSIPLLVERELKRKDSGDLPVAAVAPLN